MGSDLAVGSGALVFILMALVYVLGKKMIEKHERRSRTPCEEEQLAAMATEGKCSEFDLFRRAAQQWQVGPSQVEGDFRAYLTQGTMPHYVRDFIRKNYTRAADRDENLTSPGGGLPPSWSA